MTDAHTLSVRPCTADDVGAVLALARADEERVTGRPSQLVAGDIRDWWSSMLDVSALMDECPRGSGVYVVSYVDGQPAKLHFAGISGD